MPRQGVLGRLRPGILADRLLALVVLASALGAGAGRLGAPAAATSPWWLALLVFGVGLTLRVDSPLRGGRRIVLPGLAIVLPWVLLIPPAVLLARTAPGAAAGGLLALAAAPSEVSALLLTVAGGGDAALAASTVMASLLLTPLVAPSVFAAARLPRAVDPAGLAGELVLGVVLPLALAALLAARLRGPVWAALSAYGSDIGAVGLFALMVGAGSSTRAALERASFGPGEALIAAAGIAVAIAVPFGLSWAVTACLRLERPAQIAFVLASGMREFGVATALAQAAVPAGSAIPAAYGILMMLLASALARRFRPR